MVSREDALCPCILAACCLHGRLAVWVSALLGAPAVPSVCMWSAPGPCYRCGRDPREYAARWVREGTPIEQVAAGLQTTVKRSSEGAQHCCRLRLARGWWSGAATL